MSFLKHDIINFPTPEMIENLLKESEYPLTEETKISFSKITTQFAMGDQKKDRIPSYTPPSQNPKKALKNSLILLNDYDQLLTQARINSINISRELDELSGKTPTATGTIEELTEQKNKRIASRLEEIEKIEELSSEEISSKLSQTKSNITKTNQDISNNERD